MIAHKESDFTVLPVKTDKDKDRFNITWHSRWIEEGYAQVNEDIIQKYAKYDPYSVDFLLLNTENDAIGTLRIINQNNDVGLPVLNDFFVNEPFNVNEILCEATLLTVKQSGCSKSPLATFILLVELWKYVRRNNIDGIVIAADIRLWYLLRNKLGLLFKQIGEQKMYEGSITIPGYLNVSEQKEQAMKSAPRNLLENAFHEF